MISEELICDEIIGPQRFISILNFPAKKLHAVERKANCVYVLYFRPNKIANNDAYNNISALIILFGNLRRNFFYPVVVP